MEGYTKVDFKEAVEMVESEVQLYANHKEDGLIEVTLIQIVAASCTGEFLGLYKKNPKLHLYQKVHNSMKSFNYNNAYANIASGCVQRLGRVASVDMAVCILENAKGVDRAELYKLFKDTK